jgi:formylglycine-generating enzyme required for sulfatase activity
LRPAKTKLIKPLASIFRDTTEEKLSRGFATETVADYAADRPDELFDLLADSEQFQFPVVFDKLARYKDEAIGHAQAELTKHPSENATESLKELLAKRQANVAVAMFRLGTPQKVWPLLKFSPDPRVRSYVIHWISPLGADTQAIVQRLDAEPDVTIRRALVLTLGQFTDTQFSAVQRQPLIEKLTGVYENEPDAGLHGAVEWLLRKWDQGKRLEAVLDKLKSDDKHLQARKTSDIRQWYVSTQIQTFVIVNAGEFLMGSPESEPGRRPDEVRHRCRIGRRFAISAHEVTKSQYRTFQQAVKGFDLANNDQLRRYVRTDDSAQTDMTWYEAAHYCDWLSEQENIPRDQWCYDPKGGVYGPGMKAKEKFWDLKGYRLPTEAEWEFACRAGTVTSRYYGLTERLLPQ